MRIDPSGAVLAILEALRPQCAGLPGSEEYVMVHHPAFRVGKKPFVIVGLDAERKGATLAVNLGREAQDMLLEDARFSRTPYIGQHGWVTVVWSALEKGEREALVRDSWRRVAGKRQLEALTVAGLPAASAARAVSRGRTKQAAKAAAEKVRTKPASPAKKAR